nr:uncharacterized protein LOC129283299 [Lytechinus pictus]
MSGFYRKFVPNYSSVVSPLTNLLKAKVKYVWSDECQRSFEKLKAILVNEPVLAAPNFTKPFKVAIDACDVGVGAVLLQEDEEGIEKPVCYHSKKLNRFQKKYSTIEKEALSLVLALQQFEVYLTNGEITKKTVTVISEGGTSSLSTIPISSQSAGNHPAETVDSGSTSETRGPRKESEKNFDGILREIAKRVNKGQDVDDLGCKLGFHPSEIESYLENNRNTSHMGTLKMLRDWRNKTKKSEERELLRQALIEIKYVQLADELLPEC